MEFEYVWSPPSLPRGGWRFNGDAAHGSRGWRWPIVRRDPPAPASSCAKPARLAGDVVTIVALERSRGRFNLGHQVVQLIGATGEVIRLPGSLKHGLIVGVGRPGHPEGLVGPRSGNETARCIPLLGRRCLQKVIAGAPGSALLIASRHSFASAGPAAPAWPGRRSQTRSQMQVNGGRVCRWSMAGLPDSDVCEFVRIFPLQAHSSDLSCTFSCVKTRCDLS